jgi:DNA-binding NarL/FixJ family response regulator
MTRPRLVIADDHLLVIEGLRKLLEPEFEVIETVTDGREAVAAASRERPDIVLMDVSMPVLNGFEAAREIRKVCPGCRIVFMSMHSAPDYVRAAFRAGGAAYVVKRCAASELVAAIRRVLAGETYVSPLVAPSSPEHAVALTERQRQVLRLIAEGRASKEIAAALGISVKTVEFHKSALFQKLRIRTTAELTRYAIERGIVTR